MRRDASRSGWERVADREAPVAAGAREEIERFRVRRLRVCGELDRAELLLRGRRHDDELKLAPVRGHCHEQLARQVGDTKRPSRKRRRPEQRRRRGRGRSRGRLVDEE